MIQERPKSGRSRKDITASHAIVDFSVGTMVSGGICFVWGLFYPGGRITGANAQWHLL